MITVENFLKENHVHKSQIQKESFASTPLQKTNRVNRETLNQKQISSGHTNFSSTKDSSLNPFSKLPLKENRIQDDLTVPLTIEGKSGKSQKAQPKIIRAFLNGEKIEISASSDIPVLEQLLSTGYSPPFSCLSGSCMSCLAILKTGLITQNDRGILEDENIKNHEILTCQAKPQSQLVEVDYDH